MTIVLTGAAGLVGSTILERARESEMISLRHVRAVANSGRTVAGDITKPQLGLPESTYSDLCEESHLVIHCAATVSMAASNQDYASINVAGTRQVAKFAEDASATLVHLSTAFVHRYEPTAGPSRTYQASKQAAEQIVRASRARSVIIRPSIVVGDSRSGLTAAAQGFHLAIGSLVDGPVRVVPGDARSLVDFVPRDYVADAVLAIARAPDPPPELWLTCGERALSLADLADGVNRFIAAERLGGDAVRVAGRASLALTLMHYRLASLSPRQRVRLRVVLQLVEQLNVDDAFPSSAELVERRYGLRRPDPARVLEANLRARGGRPKVSGR